MKQVWRVFVITPAVKFHNILLAQIAVFYNLVEMSLLCKKI